MPDLTPERLREIKARHAATTPDEWEHAIDVSGPGHDRVIQVKDPGGDGWVIIREEDCSKHWKQGRDEANYEFLAHAHQDIPDLVHALKQAREERDGYAALNQKLTAFFRDGMSAAFDGLDWYGADIQDKAEELGLIHMEPYDPEKHAEHGSFEGEAGDPFYVIEESVLADPAECLKARDAEKDRQIALLTKTIDSLVAYEPLAGMPKRQADSQERAG